MTGVRWLLLAAAAISLVVHSLAYNFVTDDAYISFVYARNLAEHGELVFNLGDYVEGYTNFLWTVLLGGLMALGLPPEISSRVLAAVCSAITLYLTLRIMDRALADRVRPLSTGTTGIHRLPRTATSGSQRMATIAGGDPVHTPWSSVPAVLLAASSGFACWTSGGLETALFTMLVTAGLESVVAAVDQPRAFRRAGIFFALAAMTRPEGLLVAAILGVVHLGHRVMAYITTRGTPFADRSGFALWNELIAFVWFVGLWGPWMIWRYWYYGWLFPNTYYVKAAGDWIDASSVKPQLARQMFDNGLYYLWVWLKQTYLLYALPLATLGFIVGRPRTPRFVLAASCSLLAVGYLAYAASVGGDFMGLHRFIMPIFVVMAIAVTLGLHWVMRPAERRGKRALLLAGVVGAFILANAFIHGGRGEVPDLDRYIPARYFPLLVIAGTALLVLGLRWLVRAIPEERRFLVSAFACLVLVGGFAFTQYQLTRRSLTWGNFGSDRGIDTPAFLIAYTEDRATIGRAMAPCLGPDDFGILGGAGAKPYYARLRGIDVFGLVSDKIAHREPRMRARAGHTKWGSDPLLASYDPTFVFSCYRLHRTAAQPQLPCAGFWLARGYEHVTLHIPGLREQGEYYTFLAKKARSFQCPNRVH